MKVKYYCVLLKIILALLMPISAQSLVLDEQLRGFLEEDDIIAEPDPAEIEAEIFTSRPQHISMILVNKHSSKREQIEIAIGESYTWHDLLLEPLECIKWEGGGAGSSKARLQIWNVAAEKRQNYFSGWFYANYPELSNFSHPKYELLLTGCNT